MNSNVSVIIEQIIFNVHNFNLYLHVFYSLKCFHFAIHCDIFSNKHLISTSCILLTTNSCLYMYLFNDIAD